MRGDPRTALEANKRGIGHLVRKMDYKQDVRDLLFICLHFEIVDAVTGTSYEISIHMTGITLDNNDVLLWIPILSLIDFEFWTTIK
jgi:hypothetical protein